MASCFFILRQFADVNIYLASIKPYVFSNSVSPRPRPRPAARGWPVLLVCPILCLPELSLASSQEFNWNYGISLAAEHDYETAEQVLLQISDESFTSEYVYIAW